MTNLDISHATFGLGDESLQEAELVEVEDGELNELPVLVPA